MSATTPTTRKRATTRTREPAPPVIRTRRIIRRVIVSDKVPPTLQSGEDVIERIVEGGYRSSPRGSRPKKGAAPARRAYTKPWLKGPTPAASSSRHGLNEEFDLDEEEAQLAASGHAGPAAQPPDAEQPRAPKQRRPGRGVAARPKKGMVPAVRPGSVWDRLTNPDKFPKRQKDRFQLQGHRQPSRKGGLVAVRQALSGSDSALDRIGRDSDEGMDGDEGEHAAAPSDSVPPTNGKAARRKRGARRSRTEIEADDVDEAITALRLIATPPPPTRRSSEIQVRRARQDPARATTTSSGGSRSRNPDDGKVLAPAAVRRMKQGLLHGAEQAFAQRTGKAATGSPVARRSTRTSSRERHAETAEKVRQDAERWRDLAAERQRQRLDEKRARVAAMKARKSRKASPSVAVSAPSPRAPPPSATVRRRGSADRPTSRHVDEEPAAPPASPPLDDRLLRAQEAQARARQQREEAARLQDLAARAARLAAESEVEARRHHQDLQARAPSAPASQPVEVPEARQDIAISSLAGPPPPTADPSSAAQRPEPDHEPEAVAAPTTEPGSVATKPLSPQQPQGVGLGPSLGGLMGPVDAHLPEAAPPRDITPPPAPAPPTDTTPADPSPPQPTPAVVDDPIGEATALDAPPTPPTPALDASASPSPPGTPPPPPAPESAPDPTPEPALAATPPQPEPPAAYPPAPAPAPAPAPLEAIAKVEEPAAATRAPPAVSEGFRRRQSMERAREKARAAKAHAERAAALRSSRRASIDESGGPSAPAGAPSSTTAQLPRPTLLRSNSDASLRRQAALAQAKAQREARQEAIQQRISERLNSDDAIPRPAPSDPPAHEAAAAPLAAPAAPATATAATAPASQLQGVHGQLESIEDALKRELEGHIPGDSRRSSLIGTGTGNGRTSPAPAQPSSQHKHVCDDCGQGFLLRSTLLRHGRDHDANRAKTPTTDAKANVDAIVQRAKRQHSQGQVAPLTRVSRQSAALLLAALDSADPGAGSAA